MSSDDYTIRLSTNRSHNSHDPQSFQNNGKHNISGNNNNHTSTLRGSAPLSMSMTIPSNQAIQPSNTMPTNESSSNGLNGSTGVNGGYIDMQARNEKRGPVTPKPFLKKGSRKVSWSHASVYTISVNTDPCTNPNPTTPKSRPKPTVSLTSTINRNPVPNFHNSIQPYSESLPKEPSALNKVASPVVSNASPTPSSHLSNNNGSGGGGIGNRNSVRHSTTLPTMNNNNSSQIMPNMHIHDEETSRHQHQHQQQHQQHHQQQQHMDDDDEGEILLQGSDYWQLDNTGCCSFIHLSLPVCPYLSLPVHIYPYQIDNSNLYIVLSYLTLI